MRKVAAGLTLVWLLTGVGIEIASYLPFDPEWTDLATFALFGTSFLIGALGAFFHGARVSSTSGMADPAPDVA
jgi:prepilin signal peptidase PulO-like enzyme (type II secretory pathway)